MAEEARFFLRTALYSLVITGIYWFASYDPVRDRYDFAGTIMLGATALAATAVVAVLLLAVRRARGEGPPGSPFRLVNRVLGFADPAGAADERPLSSGLDPVPSGSAWPVGAGIGAMLVAMGLVFGPWLLLPGIVVVGACAWGWITQFDG